MNEQKSKLNISTSLIEATTTTVTSSDAMSPRQRMAQNFQLIWIDTNIDQSKQDRQNTLIQLQTVVNDVYIFAEKDEAVDFLSKTNDRKTFLVVDDTVGRVIVPLIHDVPQLDTICIFCDNQSSHEQWTNKWVKIKGVHAEIKSVCDVLQLAVKQYNQDSIAVSFLSMGGSVSNKNLNQLEPSFMYTQIFKEILLEIEYDNKSIEDLVNYCRTIYKDNMKELTIIQGFELNYRKRSPIWWYTRECFLYQMLNRALRMLEGDIIINMGFFIRDLHYQIEQLYQKQISKYGRKPFIVYRGQGLLKTDFESLLKSKGGLMSFNNFVSTSKKREVSLVFAQGALTKSDMVGILFKMTIDPSISSIPFASIQEISYCQIEEEILLSMHTVFRVGEITKLDNNHSLYQVYLTLTADDDQQLRILTQHIRKEVVGETGWRRLAKLLLKLNQFEKAEELYNLLLEQTSDPGEKAIYYNNLGCIKDGQGDYKNAIKCYEKAREISETILSPNDPSLAISYGNIGGLYDSMGEYSKALSYHEKTLQIYQKTLPANHPSIATCYNNIGLVYMNMGQYLKALAFYEKGYELWEKTLPLNHPTLATCYNNIGLVYNKMGKYPKALIFYEKALEIRQKALPPNHRSLGTSYNCIGTLYHDMEEYSKALSFYKKNLEICQQTLPPNHPDLAICYNNISQVYYIMKEYSKALSYLEHSLDIFQRSLPPNHPNIKNARQGIEIIKEKL